MLSFLDSAAWRPAIKRMPGVHRVIDLSVVMEDWWFDFYHNVDTSSQFREQKKLGWPKDNVNFHYLPIRPKCARRVLRDLPLKNRADYRFVDFGSGKGRMLLIAAECGFRRLCGIELRRELHDQACKNVRQLHNNTNGCSIEFLNMDAADYEYPDEKLVLFFFNPFGSEVMAKVLRKLIASLDRKFRDVWVVLHDPSCAYLADNTPQLRLQVAQNGYRIYRNSSSTREAELTSARFSASAAQI